MDQGDYDTWMGGGSLDYCTYEPDSVTGNTYSCTAPTADWYYLVFWNTSDNWVSRTVHTTRYVSKEEVSRRHLMALFDELNSLGMNYTSVPGTFFEGTQNVRLPPETLAGTSGNCIDGTLVFASALEAVGMEPIVFYTNTHAWVGVYSWDDTATILPLETTLVNAGNFWNAYVAGWNNYDDDPIIIDVKALRSFGIFPMNI